MRDFTELLADLHRRVDDARAYLQIDAARNRLAELEQEASRPDLWDDQDQARKVTTELARVRDDLEVFDVLEERLSEIETLFQLGREEGDDSVEPEIDAGATALSADLDKLELRALFTGEHDERDAICEVHWGAGATIPFGINDGGQIVGTYLVPGGQHGFLDSGGSFTPKQ